MLRISVAIQFKLHRTVRFGYTLRKIEEFKKELQNINDELILFL